MIHDEDINGGEEAARAPFCTVCDTRHDENVDCPDDPPLDAGDLEDQIDDAMDAADEVNARVKATLSEQRRALAVIGFPTDSHDGPTAFDAMAKKWSNR